MDRPRFEEIKSYEEFCKYYWYRAGLCAICKSLGIEYVGNKSQLNDIIKSWFDGVIIKHTQEVKIRSNLNTELTLQTGVIECGFTFGNRFRDFYIAETGDCNFKFTADMVATVKAVKANLDYDFTLEDLLNIKLGKKIYAKYDNSSCQWNKYLKDFCADKANDIYKDKLKVASKFWSLLRDSNLPKVYTREFVEQNKDKI